jgi:hypothetical protein
VYGAAIAGSASAGVSFGLCQSVPSRTFPSGSLAELAGNSAPFCCEAGSSFRALGLPSPKHELSNESFGGLRGARTGLWLRSEWGRRRDGSGHCRRCWELAMTSA